MNALYKTQQVGFTLIELIMVLVLLATVTALSLPRFFDSNAAISYLDQNELTNAMVWVRNRALNTNCSYELRISATGWRILKDDDKDGNRTDNDCASKSDPGDGCSAPNYLSFIERNDADIEQDLSNQMLASDRITSSTLHRLIFSPHGQLYYLNTLPTNLSTGCTDLSATNPVTNNTTLILDQINLSLDGETAYVTIQ